MVKGVFSYMDLIMGPIWLLILYFLIVQISKRYKDPFLRKHFKWGFTVKLIGCLAFIAVYGFYYGDGDTYNYFRSSRLMVNAIQQKPSLFFKAILTPEFGIYEQSSLGLSSTSGFIAHAVTYTVIRFILLFTPLTGGSYLAISFCFVFASYIGVWGLYRVVSDLYPKYYKKLVIPVLYIPSIVLWCSGIMKDTIVLGFIGLLTYGIYKLFFKRRKVLLQLFIIIISFYVLANVKQYVVFTYAPMLLLWIVLSPINKMSRLKRLIILPFLGLILIGIIALIMPLMEGLNEQYAIDNVLNTAESTAGYIYRVSADQGSAYSLGDVNYTPAGILKVFPQAVAVTLFRPFLFEVRNPVMLMSALESTLFLFLTLYILLKVGLLRFIGYITKDSFLLMCFLFSILFSFAVGVSTFNFGSLARYKTPALIFYGILLIVPYYQYLYDKKYLHKKR